MDTPTNEGRKSVRTCVSLPGKVKGIGDEIVEARGFSSFSSLVEYLLRLEYEKEMAQAQQAA